MTADKRRTDACLKACEGISTQNLENNEPFLELARRYNVALREREALRAKIEQMEKQEPVAYLPLSSARILESGVIANAVVWNCRDKAAYSIPLYTLPGAQTQPAPSVPDGWQLVPTAESRHPGIYKMLGALHSADNTPGVSEWESYRAMLAAAPEAKP